MSTPPYPSPYQYPAPGSGWGGAPQPPSTPPVTYAMWPSRVGASLVDQLVVSVVPGILIMFAVVTGTPVIRNGRETVDPTAVGAIVATVGFLMLIGMWVWNRVIRQGKTGQSIGKKVLGIDLVSANTGQPVGAGASFLRELCHIADAPLYVGYLWPLWDERRQTFADKLVSTYVVQS